MIVETYISSEGQLADQMIAAQFEEASFRFQLHLYMSLGKLLSSKAERYKQEPAICLKCKLQPSRPDG
jgi:hypothetical protein